MKVALKGKPQKGFHEPPGLTRARIDKKTGKLAAPGEADGDVLPSEVFLTGTEPTEIAPAPGEVDPTQYQMGGGP
jgi:membrane carboxypeptidase/penicillin-binding protein